MAWTKPVFVCYIPVTPRMPSTLHSFDPSFSADIKRVVSMHSGDLHRGLLKAIIKEAGSLFPTRQHRRTALASLCACHTRHPIPRRFGLAARAARRPSSPSHGKQTENLPREAPVASKLKRRRNARAPHGQLVGNRQGFGISSALQTAHAVGFLISR